jgi:hypothetical protein
MSTLLTAPTAPLWRAVIFLLAARKNFHSVVENGPLQLEGLGCLGVAPSVA